MPPKRQHTRESIINAALQIAREHGLNHLSARTVAQTLGCSTSPIYVNFATMEELHQEVRARAAATLSKHQQDQRTPSPLVNACLGYVWFAKREKLLFRDLFLANEGQGGLDSLPAESLRLAAAQEPAQTGLSEESLEILWTYTHGLAAQANTGARDWPSQEALGSHLGKAIAFLAARRAA